MTSRERFLKLQTAWREADARALSLRQDLNGYYQSYQYAPAAKRRKLEQLDRVAHQASDRFWNFLRGLAPRNFEAGVPAAWARDHLTFEDATTRGALSVVPPPAYGYTEGFTRLFALPLSGEK